MTKPYSDLSVAVDIVMETYNTSNPIIISEKIQEELGLEFTIHQISDYLAVDRMEDYEQESLRQEYYAY
ncbi:MAG TPA: hypothetical protein VF680_17080 [Allosphingosinicella sp.]|jgi:hypothetical protein